MPTINNLICEHCEGQLNPDRKKKCYNCNIELCETCLEEYCPVCNKYTIEKIIEYTFDYFAEHNGSFNFNSNSVILVYKDPQFACKKFSNTPINNHQPHCCDCEWDMALYDQFISEEFGNIQTIEGVIDKFKEFCLDDVDYGIGITGISELIHFMSKYE